MNVLLILITVILMLPVLTLLAVLHVLVTLDMKEMASHVQVCSLSDIYTRLLIKIKRNDEHNINKISIKFFRHR